MRRMLKVPASTPPMKMQTDAIQNISDAAFWVAHHRALESAGFVLLGAD